MKVSFDTFRQIPAKNVFFRVRQAYILPFLRLSGLLMIINARPFVSKPLLTILPVRPEAPAALPLLLPEAAQGQKQSLQSQK